MVSDFTPSTSMLHVPVPRFTVPVPIKKIRILDTSCTVLGNVCSHVDELQQNIRTDNYDSKNINDVKLSIQYTKDLLSENFECKKFTSKLNELKSISDLLHYIARSNNKLFF